MTRSWRERVDPIDPTDVRFTPEQQARLADSIVEREVAANKALATTFQHLGVAAVPVLVFCICSLTVAIAIQLTGLPISGWKTAVTALGSGGVGAAVPMSRRWLKRMAQRRNSKEILP